jgi:hypothetical protein
MPKSPVMKYSHDAAKFEVFHAKAAKVKLEDSPFCDQILLARKSYERYGNVPKTDRYDTHCDIYLVRTSFTVKKTLTEEWFSVRFLQQKAVGNAAAHEFLQCNVNGIPLHQTLRGGDKNTTVISRICGIPSPLHPLHKLEYAGLAFALATDAYLLNQANKGINILFLVGLFRDELIENSLLLVRAGKRLPIFGTITDLLGPEHENSVRIDRTIDAYAFPAYFFNFTQLHDFLRNAVNKGTFRKNLLAKYLGGKENVRKVISGKQLELKDFRNLGTLFCTKGKINGTQLTGLKLRHMLDKSVADGPRLRSISVERWSKDRRLLFGQERRILVRTPDKLNIIYNMIKL